MSAVIERYKDIMDSAKDFDTFMKTTLIKMKPIEVEVSLRLSKMIQEAEVVLTSKLDNHEHIVRTENKRLAELQDKVNNEQAENKKQLEYIQKERAELEKLSVQYTTDLHNFKNLVEEYKLNKLNIDQQQGEINSTLCSIKIVKGRNETILEDLRKEKQDVACAYANLKEKVKEVVEIEKNIAKEKKDIELAYIDLNKQRENVINEVKRISDMAVDDKLSQIKEIENKTILKEQEASKRLKELDDKIKEYETKRKNSMDKEYNLKAYEAQLNITMAKFKEEVNNFNKDKNA